jgi:glycosyltransferase involved in cell wall biosynthesis
VILGVSSKLKQKITIISFGYMGPQGSGGGVVSWHLGKTLYNLDGLDKVIIFSKGKLSPDFPCRESIPYTKYYLYLRHILRLTAGRVFHVPYHIIRGIDEKLFDICCKRIAVNRSNIYLYTHPVVPKTLDSLSKKGITSILLALNPYDTYIRGIVADEKKKYSITDNDAYTSDFRLRAIEQCISKFTCIISPSSVISDSYARYGYGGKIINLGFPIGPSLESNDEQQIPEERSAFRVCYLGHTVLLKGLQYLLEAWEGIDANNSELIIGGGIDENIKKIINSRFSHLKNIRYAGWVKDARQFYSMNNVFISPSLVDGGPRTVFEAMACGLPVIVTEGCGAKDVIEDGKEGFIIPVRDAQALREKILWCQENPLITRQMGINAKEKIKQYNIENFTARIINLLKDL